MKERNSEICIKIVEVYDFYKLMAPLTNAAVPQ